jgi:hypothetical protein
MTPVRKFPVRKIGRGHRGIRGHASFFERSVSFESTLEHDFLLRLSIHPGLLDIVEQPETIRYRDATGKGRRYTPDFLVTYADPVRGACEVVYEIKYRSDLEENWPELRPRLRAGIGWARSRGARFCIMTEREIRTPALECARILKKYRMLEPDAACEAALLAAAVPGATLGSIARAAATDPSCRDAVERASAQAFRLLALGRLTVAFDRPLSPAVPVLRNPNEGASWPPLFRA